VCLYHDVAVEAERLAWLQGEYAALGCGYTDLVHYSVQLNALEPVPPLSDGVRITQTREADPRALAECIRAALSGPALAFFFGASPEEREQFLAGLLASSAGEEPASSILYVQDELVGLLTALNQDDKRNLLIDWMGLRPEWQRRGLGRLLLRHALATATAGGYPSASGSANTANTSSIRLFESLG